MRHKYLIIPALIVALLLVFSRQILAFFSTLFLILQVFPQMPVKPLTWVTLEPQVEQVEFEYNARGVIGKFFKPQTNGKHPALILALAVKTSEKDEPQIENFAKSAARLGFVVLVPHSKDLQKGVIKIEDKDTFVGAFEFLSQNLFVNKKKISYLGISAGSSIALKAASDQKIANLVRSFISFGGYFEAKDYFSSLITGKARYKDGEVSWQPDPGALFHAKEVIINLAPKEEQPILSSVLHEGKIISSKEQRLLSPESQFAISVFSAKTPMELEEIWQKAPKEVDENLGRLSPSQGIENLKTRLFILHDQGDRYVSYVESIKLNEALPKDIPRIYLEVSLFEHVQPKGGANPAILLDFARLYLFIYQAILFLS